MLFALSTNSYWKTCSISTGATRRLPPKKVISIAKSFRIDLIQLQATYRMMPMSARPDYVEIIYVETPDTKAAVHVGRYEDITPVRDWTWGQTALVRWS